MRCAGGRLFDQVLAGWDVTVVTAETDYPRPLADTEMFRRGEFIRPRLVPATLPNA